MTFNLGTVEKREDSTIDEIGFSEDSALMSLIERDRLLLADKVEKWSGHFNTYNKRIFVITNNAIYHIEGKQIKQKFEIKQL